MEEGHFASCATPKNCWCEVKRYGLVFALALIVFFAEVLCGIWSNSFALLADARHALVDASDNLISILVAYLVKSGLDKHKTRSWGGVINALLLGAVAVWIFIDAVEHWQHPRDIASGIMIIGALIGTIGHYIRNRILDKADAHDITHDEAHAHIVSDLAQSIIVIIGGIGIALTGWTRIDPFLSFILAFWMGGWALVFLWRIRSGHYKH